VRKETPIKVQLTFRCFTVGFRHQYSEVGKANGQPVRTSSARLIVPWRAKLLDTIYDRELSCRGGEPTSKHAVECSASGDSALTIETNRRVGKDYRIEEILQMKT
jgi:hypothetical protein